MILKRGGRVHANRDPTDIYTTLTDVEDFFRRTDEGAVNTGNAMRLSAVAAAHRIYTDALAVLPWQIRQRDGDNRNEVDHAIGDLLHGHYNSLMGQFTAERAILSSAFWYGAGYAAIIRDRFGHISEIFPLPGHSVTREVNPEDGAVWYSFSVNQDAPGYQRVQRKFMESELLIYRFESMDGYTGRGMLDVARESIAADNAAQSYNRKFFTNGSRVSGIVKVKTALDKDTRETVRNDFERMAHGIDNAFRVAVLDNGLEYSPLGISQKDSQFIESRSFSVEEISRFTGIPAYMLQTGKQSYNSNEQQQIDFAVNFLMPRLVQMEQQWGYKLLTDDERAAGMYLKKNMNAVMRGTADSRAAYYDKMIAMSCMNADEVRALEDMNPLPNGMGKIYRFTKNYENVEGGDG